MAEHHQTPRASSEPAVLLNEKIPYKTFKLISHDGKNLGQVTREEALRLAREVNLDLVIIYEKDDGPVAKIMDFGRAAYAKKKQQAAARKNQKTIHIKELQLGPKIGEHDFQTKMNRMSEFLKDGNHVRVVMNFRGREIPSRDTRGAELFEKIDAFLGQVIGGSVQREKDSKATSAKAASWSRVYYTK